MELNPQAIIDEMSKRIHSLTIENIVLQARVTELQKNLLQLVSGAKNTDDSET